MTYPFRTPIVRSAARTCLLRRAALAAIVAAALFSGPALRGAAALAETAPAAATLSTRGGDVAYLKAGAGPALVIVHGVGGHKEDWQGVMAALSGGRTVYAIDMLGFGGSSRDAPDLSMAAQTAALLALLDKEGIAKTDLLGNSVGGWVTATFAADHPDRVGKLAVADIAGFKAMFEGEIPVNFFPSTVEDMQKLLSYVLYSDFAHAPEFAEKALENLQASGEPAIAERLLAGLATSPKLEEVMPKITAPTLVIWGREDRLFPVALAPYITGLTPGATSAIIEKAGHFPQVDNPDAFIAAVKPYFAE